MNDKRCASCKWWEASDLRWWEKGNNGVPEGKYGDCNNVDKIHEGHLPYGMDHLIYQYSESGGFTAGKDFGCVHWTRRPDAVAISRCRKCDKELSVGDRIEGADLCPACYAKPVVETGENPNGICPRCHTSWRDVPKLTSPEEAGIDIRLNTGSWMTWLGLEITKLEARRCPECGTYGIIMRMDGLVEELERLRSDNARLKKESEEAAEIINSNRLDTRAMED